MRKTAPNLHWVITAILITALIPASAAVGLPLRLDWARFFSVYWIILTLTSAFLATFLFLVGFPLRETLLPLWGRYRSQMLRFPFLAMFAAAMIWEFGWVLGMLLVVDTVAFLEFFDRINGDFDKLKTAAVSVFVPAAYLFVCVIVVFCYNDVIASVRFYGAYDSTFNRIDSILFLGTTVSSLARLALRSLPLGFFKFFEIVYYGMFNQMGAAFIIIAIYFGKKRALEFAGTLATAYYLSLVIFFCWPSIGPFAFRSTHFASYPQSITTFGIQTAFLDKAKALWTHQHPSPVNTDFFIAFPSMHIAQPLIVLWFLRKWKRIAVILMAYDALLIPAILLLEWHYFIDLVGGVLVTVVAIAMVNANFGLTESGRPRLAASNELSDRTPEPTVGKTTNAP